MIPTKRILVVEDEPDFREMVGNVLEEAGYGVISAANGREAMEMQVNGDVTPDLILLDLRMPVMDGWEFARVLRCYRRFVEIPIIVISTPGINQTWHPRVEGVLAKPFSPDALLTEVHKHAPLESSAAG